MGPKVLLQATAVRLTIECDALTVGSSIGVLLISLNVSGSTTAALVALLQKVTSLLESNSYVVVIALDYSKAFDTVRHSCLMEKVARVNVPNNINNWLTNFFNGHTHSTRYRDPTSDLSEINASIIQGSAIWSASYVVYAADFQTVRASNSLIKDADDTYLIIPTCNVDSRQQGNEEMDHSRMV